MRYTVSSDGVVIGETDLGFARCGDAMRAGWFHPSEAGERLLPRIIPPLLAMRARLDAADRDAWSGDLAAATHHADAHPLTLHRPDGSVVPTRILGFQDTHQLLALAEWDDARRDAEGWTPDDEVDDDDLFVAAVEQADGDAGDALAGDARAGDALAGDAPDDDPPDLDAPWAPDDEPTDLPRYQIVLQLADADAIP